MLANLKFVQGAIKKNNITPELEHYRIEGGRVTGFNGHMALSAPLDLDLEAYPNAGLFYKAIEACKEKTAMYLTDTGRLAIRSGGFRAYIPCLDDVGYKATPEGDEHPVPEEFVKSLRRVAPFISEDASRPWSMGLLFNKGSLIATNNVILVQQWTGHDFPEINLPRFAVAEMVRIGEDPIKASISEHSATFHYADGRWLRTQLFDQKWPFDKLEHILSAEDTPKPLPEGFAEAVDTLVPFLGERSSAVYFQQDQLSTSMIEEDGVHLTLEGIPEGPVFSIGQLKLLASVATKIDWDLYPNPCIFHGEKLRGAVVGMIP